MVMYLIDELIALINGEQEQRQTLDAVELSLQQSDGRGIMWDEHLHECKVM